MRFLLTSVGSSGDVHPYIGIGRELLARGHITEARANELEQAARAEIEAAVQFAVDSPYPALEALHADVYA